MARRCKICRARGVHKKGCKLIKENWRLSERELGDLMQYITEEKQPGTRQPSSLTRVEKDTLISDYNFGMPLQRLVEKYGFASQAMVYELLREEGVPTRKKKKQIVETVMPVPPAGTSFYVIDEKTDKTIIRMYEQGIYGSIIRQKLDISLATLYKVLDFHNIPRHKKIAPGGRRTRKTSGPAKPARTWWQKVESWLLGRGYR